LAVEEVDPLADIWLPYLLPLVEDIDLRILTFRLEIEVTEQLQPIISDVDHSWLWVDFGLGMVVFHHLVMVLLGPGWLLWKKDCPEEVAVTEGKLVLFEDVWKVVENAFEFSHILDGLSWREFMVFSNAWRYLSDIEGSEVLLFSLKDLLHELETCVFEGREQDSDSLSHVTVKVLPRFNLLVKVSHL
jgi:hypothetical protein